MAKKKRSTQDKAVIYARFSPRTKADECESCERQIEICRKYCKFYGLKVIGEYADKNKSGGTVKYRSGLQKAIEQTCRNKANLVVFSMSRLARNLGDLIEISNRLQKAGAGLCSTKEKIDTSTAQGDLFFKMIGLIDEFIRKSNAEYTSRMMRQHQEAGRRMSDRLPYGWKEHPKDPSRMVPCEYERKVIKRVVALRQQGCSLREIVRKLEEEGYKPRKIKRQFKGRTVWTKGKWNHILVRSILQRKGMT